MAGSHVLHSRSLYSHGVGVEFQVAINVTELLFFRITPSRQALPGAWPSVMLDRHGGIIPVLQQRIEWHLPSNGELEDRSNARPVHGNTLLEMLMHRTIHTRCALAFAGLVKCIAARFQCHSSISCQ